MHDLIVIGAGPSGATAARRAGQIGLRTLLMDKASFPRHKPCGGAVSEQALCYLDFDLPLALQERDVFGARVSFQNHVIDARKRHRIAVLVTRSSFDLHLLERAAEAGSQLRMEERVLECEQHTDHVKVITSRDTVCGRYVIVAEGAQGSLKHLVRRPDVDDEYGICVVAEVSDANVDQRIYKAIEIHFGVAGGGYGWVFPHRGYFSVGVGGLARNMDHAVSTLRTFLRDNGFQDNQQFRGHTIPVGGIRRRLVNSRIILAGDAAGFVDSFSGEGIAYAIRSGQIAAEAVTKVLEDGTPESLETEYSASCWRAFGRNLKWSLVLSRLMHFCPKLFLRALASDEAILGKYLDVASAKVTYAQYLCWLLPKALRFAVKGGLFA